MRPLLLLAFLGVACAFTSVDQHVVSQYGEMAIMRDCFGAQAYKSYVKKMNNAVAACRTKAYTARSTGPAIDPATRKRGIYFEYERVKELSRNMRMLVSNSTCILHQMGYIDDSYNIQYQNMIDEVKDVGRLDRQLMEDLVDAVNKCKDFTTCLPVDQIPYPMGLLALRYINFSTCRNQANLVACVKKEFRDLEPDVASAGSETVVGEKLVSLLWGKKTNIGIF